MDAQSKEFRKYSKVSNLATQISDKAKIIIMASDVIHAEFGKTMYSNTVVSDELFNYEAARIIEAIRLINWNLEFYNKEIEIINKMD